MSNKYRFPNKSINKMFLHTAPYTPPLFQKKVRSPSQNLLKTFTFHPSLLIFTVVEVCNITNKNQSPSNLAKYQYFYTRDFISFLHFGKDWRFPSPGFFETSTFYHIFTIFKSE